MAANQIDERYVEELRAHIREAFELFDKERKGRVAQEEVSTIMRYLGAYPSERAIVKDILPELQEDNPSSQYIDYERFEDKMLEILVSREWQPDQEEVLLQAFRALDHEGIGYIETSRMRELLMTKGTPFREKEIESFMTVAKDAETGHIYYEDYVALLTADNTKKLAAGM
ncbi:unnamed protein product [Chrysoparadoxa australica]